jgi:hypothetical protein
MLMDTDSGRFLKNVNDEMIADDDNIKIVTITVTVIVTVTV